MPQIFSVVSSQVGRGLAVAEQPSFYPFAEFISQSHFCWWRMLCVPSIRFTQTDRPESVEVGSLRSLTASGWVALTAISRCDRGLTGDGEGEEDPDWTRPVGEVLGVSPRLDWQVHAATQSANLAQRMSQDRLKQA